jgi:hypothetical protein
MADVYGLRDRIARVVSARLAEIGDRGVTPEGVTRGMEAAWPLPELEREEVRLHLSPFTRNALAGALPAKEYGR